MTTTVFQFLSLSFFIWKSVLSLDADRRQYGSHFAAQAFMHIHHKIPPISEISNKTLRIAVPTIDPPYVNYVNFSDAEAKDRGIGPGVVIEILKDLKEMLNLTYEVVSIGNHEWGNLVNGTWTGAFGDLFRGDIDVIAGGAIMQYDRGLISDLTYPFHYDTTAMLIKRQEKKHYEKFLIITEPFRWEVWLLTILCIILSGFVFAIINRIIKSCYSEVFYSFFDCFWIFISIVLQQGLRDQPKSNSCRIMIAFWWAASLTLMATFTGSLVAIFATENRNLPFHDAHSLLKVVKQGKFTVVMDSNSMIRLRMIQNSQNEDLRQLWYELETNKKILFINGTFEAIQFVRTRPGYVFLGSRETILFYAGFDCSLLVISDELLPVYLSIPMSLNSQYSMVFSNRIRELVERGFINKWLKDYSSYAASKGAHSCNHTSSVQQAYLDLTRTQGAFWILVGGLAASILLLVIEYACHLYLKKTK